MAPFGPMSESNQRDQARLEALKKALTEDPRSLAFVPLAEEHNRLKQHAEAATVAQRGLLTHPDSVAGRLALAVAEAEQDRVKEALEQIKRALIIDQENPRALGLMGQILLKRGLAKRAVQFLTHAVKLAPKEPEYAELLRLARKQAREGEEKPVPIFGADQLPDSQNPWDGDDSEDGGGPAPGQEHTVFDPDALKKLKPKPASGSMEDLSGDGELTAYADRSPAAGRGGELPSPRRVPVDGREEPTAYATPNPLAQEKAGKKAKMGGSALEYSQMMRREAGAPQAPPPPPPDQDQADETVDGLPATAPEARSSTTSDRPKSSKPKPAPPPPPPGPAAPVEVEKKPASSPKAAKPKSGSSPPAPAPEPKAAKVEVPEPEKAKAQKGVGPVATRMVDEALWALFGQKAAAAPVGAPAAVPPPAGEAKADKPKKAKDEDAEEERPAGAQGGMVVRTSERFGAWVRVAVMFVLSATALVIGYGAIVSGAGPGIEVSKEELKGVATELEKGGLGAIIAGEEQIEEVSRGNPDLARSLAGAKAELHARHYTDFGRDPAERGRALAVIAEQRGQPPTLELLAAQVALSSSAVDRRILMAELEKLSGIFTESPKLWLLRGKLYDLEGKDTQALDAYYKAYAINPQHRNTLLELARWHARRPSYGPAFELYERIREQHPLDVEAAIERFTLGTISGEDPGAAVAVSTLAGLVREEIPEVAKDEAARAALAFAVPKLAKGQIQEGIDEIAKADAAFATSAIFRSAVAGAFLAVGDFERARKHYGKALELEPENDQHRVGLARAAFLERSGKKLDQVAEGKRLEKGVDKSGTKFPEVTLPFGTLELRYGAFELLRYLPDGELFPESTYQELAESLDGAPLQKALEAANLVALAQQHVTAGDLESAETLLSEAETMGPNEQVKLARGRLLLAQKDYAKAVKVLKEVVKKDNKDVAARLALSRALIAEDKTIDAISVLEGFEEDTVIVPEALQLLGTARLKRGDYERALTPLEQVVALRVRGAAPYLALAEAQHKLSRADSAYESTKLALERDAKVASALTLPVELAPFGPIALMYLGRAELERNNEKRGTALLQEAMKMEEVPPEAHYYLGHYLTVVKKSKKGKKELERFVKLAQPGELKDDAEKLLKKR